MLPVAALLRHRTPLVAALLGLGAASTGLAPSADGDIWWHLAAGREMVARRGLLFTDPFSVSAQGRAWVDVHWLFQLAVYAVHQAVGLVGLVLVKCALIGLGAGLLYFALEARRGSWARGLLVTSLVGGLLAARSLLLVRPVIGTLVLLAFFWFALERFRRDGRVRHLLLLPLAQLVWANFQGLSALGPAVIAAYAVAALGWASFGQTRAWPFAREHAGALAPWARVQQLFATLGGCLLATCLTPFGLRGAALPALLLGRLLPGEHQVFAHDVAENLPPFELERLSDGEFWHFKWCLALLALSVLLAGRRLRLSHALLLLGFAGLALMSNRNVLLLYWVGAPIFAVNLAPALRRLCVSSFRRAGVRAAVGLNAVLLSALLLVSASAAAREPPLADPSPFRVPAESAVRLDALPGGDVFAADHYGGYLIWRLYPRFRPYIDTRLVLRTADEFAEYLRLADEPERFEAFQARHSFAYVVLPVMFPERYQRLIGHLYASADWKLLYTDGSEVLFARRDLTPGVAEQPFRDASETDRTLVQLGQRFADSPKVHAAARLSLATLHGVLGQLEQAERTLASLDTPQARALEARLRFAAGELDAAERLARQSLVSQDDDVGSLNLMALIALRRGESAQGLGFLRRALRVRPFDPEATRILVNLEESRR
ncbi:tetratricopeptide repeat protein [Sorangium sp. So ce363]|uniref:tetratricopeptide repeat protein n=1 Tax=Sorangium sp. So ce363 TaxID=3133304 RepID=UPI003F62D4C0